MELFQLPVEKSETLITWHLSLANNPRTHAQSKLNTNKYMSSIALNHFAQTSSVQNTVEHSLKDTVLYHKFFGHSVKILETTKIHA